MDLLLRSGVERGDLGDLGPPYAENLADDLVDASFEPVRKSVSRLGDYLFQERSLPRARPP